MTDPSSAGLDNAAWVRRLDGAPPVIALPTDRARPDRLGTAIEQCEVSWTPALRAAAEELAHATGAGLYAVLLAAWQALLVRYGAGTDLVIGCSGLDAHGHDGSVHLLRQQVTPEQAFRELLTDTAAALEETAAAGPVHVPALLVAMGVDPSPGKHPIFQVGFGSDSMSGPPATPAGEPCDLVLHWRAEEAGGLSVRLDAAKALFDRPRVERMLAHLERLLRSALDTDDRPIATLRLLTREDRARLDGWNDTGHPHDATRPISALFSAQVRRTPEAVAVELGGQRLSYRELDRRADRLASALQARGVGPDVTVAVTLDRSLEQVIAVLAVLKAGGAYVPVDVAYPEARRRYMLEHSEAAVVLVAEGTAGQVPSSVRGEPLEIEPERLAVEAGREDADAPPCGATGNDLGYVIFTSGSTGQPKAVALPQAALTNLIEWQLRRPDFPAGARTLQFASLSFDVSFQEIFTTWCSGGTLVLIPDAVRRDPRSLLDHIISTGVERVFLPFVALRGLADAAVTSQRFPTTLREVYTAGEQLVVDDVVRAFFSALPGCLLENQYGPSESHVVTAERLHGMPPAWPALPAIGAPIANTRMHMLDPRGVETPPGIPGELHIGGVCLARGYLGQPELTAERFLPDPLGDGTRLYRTGDLARWRDDGSIEFLGRTDDQVKFRGFRIEPGEIGAVLSGFPGIRQCVAKVVEVEGAGARLAAYVLPAEDRTPSLADLHRFARERLPDYMVPSHIVVVEAFPLTPSGKIDLQALPAPAFDRRILGAEHVAPRSPEEAELARIWEQLLGISGIGVHDDFFDLGGDSLMAVEMFAIVQDRLGVELPLGALAEDPTIAGLAGRLRQDEDARHWETLVALSTEGAGTPLFCVHGGSGNVASFPKLARALPGRPVYALQWDGLDGSRGSRTIPAMANRYLREVRSVQPQGPYYFAGQCVGGIIAQEMARILRADGEEVGLVVMYDAPNVYSSQHRFLSPRVPAVPASLRWLANRSVGMLVELIRWLKGSSRPRRQIVRMRLLPVLRRPIPSEDRYLYGALAMLHAVWGHRIRPVDVPTLILHTGRTRTRAIGLAGFFTDGAMGWSDHQGANLEVHVVPGDHNDILYEPEAIRLLTERLSVPA